MILGIDPGSSETAFCLIDQDYRIQSAGKLLNVDMRAHIRDCLFSVAAIESIQSYGMPVGREVFDTCYEIGRLMQLIEGIGGKFTLIPRPEYTRRICGVQKVNDAVLRQALLLRFGGDKKGEALHMLKGCSDKRSAFAVAVYKLDLMKGGR